MSSKMLKSLLSMIMTSPGEDSEEILVNPTMSAKHTVTCLWCSAIAPTLLSVIILKADISKYLSLSWEEKEVHLLKDTLLLKPEFCLTIPEFCLMSWWLSDDFSSSRC